MAGNIATPMTSQKPTLQVRRTYPKVCRSRNGIGQFAADWSLRLQSIFPIFGRLIVKRKISDLWMRPEVKGCCRSTKTDLSAICSVAVTTAQGHSHHALYTRETPPRENG